MSDTAKIQEQPMKKRAGRKPIPYEKGSAEYKQEVARRALERFHKKNEKKVKKDTTFIYPTYRDAKPENALPPLRSLSVEMPTYLKPVFGEKFELNNDIPTWYFMHAKPIGALSETTQKQYKQYQLRLVKVSLDMYERLRYVLTQPVAIKAQFVKSWLAYTADKVREIYQKPQPIHNRGEYEQLIIEMFLYAHLSKTTKKEVKNIQMSQVASPARLEATIDWDVWLEKSAKYCKAIYNQKATMENHTTLALIALYSMLPPIRLDYDDVKVVSKVPTKKVRENTLVLSGPKKSAFYWVKFKNADAFERQGTLPIVIPVQGLLLKYLKTYWKTKHSLYPSDDKLFNIPHFSEKVSDVAELVSGKRFTNRLMRSSYIRHFYEQVQDGELDLAEIQEMMRNIHQTNIEVSISYIKKLAEGQEEF
jgi:hypothetical protein